MNKWVSESESKIEPLKICFMFLPLERTLVAGRRRDLSLKFLDG